MVSVRTMSGSWKSSNGKRRAVNGSDTVNQTCSHSQDDFTPPSCPQGHFLLQHFIMLRQLASSETQRFWWKEIVWV